jgi:murein DD-endopeptidase MepM/ murein hydrolase activator NlpD
MQILITHSGVSKTQVLHFNRWQLAAVALLVVVAIMLFSGAIYSVVFLKAAREGWPIIGPAVRPLVQGEAAQRERFVRENLDAMARKVGEMQAKLVKLEALGERVSAQAGVKPDDLRPQDPPMAPKARARAGQGGPFVPADRAPAGASAGPSSAATPSFDSLHLTIDEMDQDADLQADVLTLAESRLLEGKLTALMVPSIAPVAVPVGSGFGFRPDPFSGRAALHTGLDFPAEIGKPVVAAAGGVVISAEWHPAYGHMIELDHGNGLLTRYAHTSKVLVRGGDVIKRGQKVALVGTSGRSTGPHLHFEVLLDGVPQDPARFLYGRR